MSGFSKPIDAQIQRELKRRELLLGRSVTKLPNGSGHVTFSDYAARMPYAIMSTNAKDQKNNLALSYGEYGDVDTQLRISLYNKDGDPTGKSIDLRSNDPGFDNLGFTGKGNGAYVSTKDGSEVGIRPVPGIKQITCDYLSNEGYASRTATVNWSAPSLEALETFEVFLTTGYEVALQWGWSSPKFPLDSNQTFILIDEQEIKIDQSLFSNPRKKILKANGNLDAIGGRVSNFSSKLRDDGGFDCTTEIDAMGVNFYSFSGNEEAIGGLGQVLPRAVQQTIEDAKDGLIGVISSGRASLDSYKEIGSKAKEGFLGILGAREKTEEEKEVLQLSLQDHMLNALINLDSIAHYYGERISEGDQIECNGNLSNLLKSEIVISKKAVLEKAGVSKEEQATNVLLGQAEGKKGLTGTTEVVQTDSKGNPTGGTTSYPVMPGSSFGNCWIAAELYGGWYEPKTILARRYVNSDRFPKLLYNLYMKYGERVAGFIRKHKFVKPLFRPIFDIFVNRGKRIWNG
jgi:hypothetical protein